MACLASPSNSSPRVLKSLSMVSTLLKSLSLPRTMDNSLFIPATCSSISYSASFLGSLISPLLSSSAFSSLSSKSLVPSALVQMEFKRLIFSDSFCQVKISEEFSTSGTTQRTWENLFPNRQILPKS